MQTILSGSKKQVKIDTEGRVVLIGEKINPTRRKKLAEALTQRNFDYVKELALSQIKAGADVLDINVGVPGIDDGARLTEGGQEVASVVDVPICLDSPNPKALAAALAVVPGKPLVNSVNG